MPETISTSDKTNKKSQYIYPKFDITGGDYTNNGHFMHMIFKPNENQKDPGLKVITIATPESLSQSNDIGWKGVETAGFAFQAMTDLLERGEQAYSNVVDAAMKGEETDVKASITDRVASALGGLITPTGANAGEGFKSSLLRNVLYNRFGNQAGVAFGQSFNPKLQFLFETVSPRTFGFTFKFAPKTESETEEVKGIIDTIRRAALPGLSEESYLFTFPYTVSFSFRRGASGSQNSTSGKINTYLYKSKECAITNLSVNYAPEGFWVAHGKDGSPIGYEVSMQLQETEVLTRKDLEEGIAF